MIYVKFWGSAEYCGTDYEEYKAFSDNTTKDQLADEAYELGRENGESYEYLVFGWDGPDMDEYTQEEVDEEIFTYYDNLDYSYTIMDYEEWKEAQE